jgi:hypothetical protein
MFLRFEHRVEDRTNVARAVDHVRDAAGQQTHGFRHAVCFAQFTAGVAEERVRQPMRLRESRVRSGRIRAISTTCAPPSVNAAYASRNEHTSAVAAGAADRLPADMYAAVQNLYNASIGDDLRVASDPSQSVDNRLLHAGIAGVTVLSLAGGP